MFFLSRHKVHQCTSAPRYISFMYQFVKDCGKTLGQGSQKAQNASWMFMKRDSHHVAFDAIYVCSYGLDAQYLVKARNGPGPISGLLVRDQS